MSRLPLFARSAVGATIVAALIVVTAVSASRAYGTWFPSLFVDPFGGFSVVLLPDWQSARMHIAVGAPIHARDERADPDALPADRLADAVARAADRGERFLPVTIGEGDDARSVSLELRRLGTSEILWFYALYVLAGLLLLWSGVAVAVVACGRPGGRAYFALTVGAFVFLVTFLDYQTTRWLVPLFATTTLANSLTLGALAWFFPTPPRVGPIARRVALSVLGVGAALAIVLGIAAATHTNLRPLRQLADVLVPLSLLGLFGSVAFRLWRGGDRGERAELRSAAWGLFLVPLTFGVTFAFLSAIGRLSVFHMVLPFASVAVPAAIGNALIRHNVLALQAVVTQRLLVVPLALLSLAIAAACASPLWSSDRWGEFALVTITLCVALVVIGWFAIGSWLTRASRSFQPALANLAGDVAALRTTDAIRAHLAALVGRALPSRDVRVASEAERDAIALTPDARARFARGETVWTIASDDAPAALAAPLRFGDEGLGALMVSPRPGDALFSEGEVLVLTTIVNLGALALHHAELLREVEARRAIELAATKGDKLLAVDVVAAEIAHELAYPIGFLRHFLKQVSQGRASSDIIEVGQDEVDRLERMLAWVRKLQVPVPTSKQVRVQHVITKVLVLLENDLASRSVTCEVDVPDDLHVHADSDALLQLIANLLRNASQAARGRVGIRTGLHPRGDVEICVWDDGPGVPPELATRIFDPLYTTQKDSEGHGLGLAVAQRVARGFNWSIEVRRENDLTVFAVRAKRQVDRKTPIERVAS